jgi:hypothetical protein
MVVLMLGVAGFSLMPAKHGPLTCREVRDKAADYLAHRLSPALEQEFKAHIDHCDHCREVVEDVEKHQAGDRQPANRWLMAQNR